MRYDSLLADRELEKFGYIPKLSRSLNVWQLTAFGLTYLQPIGPAVVFGFLLIASQGTVALPYLLAFIGMIFTILSYSILIREYPLAGSIYNYVKLVIGPFWGFMAGWLLALDYILIPTITSVSAAIYANQLFPAISYEQWLVIFVGCMSGLNLMGIKSTTYVGVLLLLIQLAVVIAGLTIWINFIIHTNSILGLFSLKPFQFASVKGLIQASSLALFGFLGFDAVTTLAEEAINPRRDIPRAMLACTSVGITITFLTGYLGVLVMSNWRELAVDQSWINAALFKLAKLTGGDIFAVIYTIGFILAMAVTNLVGTTAASRLLYGMGRDKVIPHRLFADVNRKWKSPHGNILFIATLELVLGSFAKLDQLAELINYGALFGFTILNFTVIWFGYKILIKKIKSESLSKINSKAFFITRVFIFPTIALSVILPLFVGLNYVALVFGTLWGAVGVIYFIVKTKHVVY